MMDLPDCTVTGGSEVPMLNPMNTVIYRVVEEIEEAGHRPGDLLVYVTPPGLGSPRIGPTLLEVMRWLGRGWVEEVPFPKEEHEPKIPETA